MHPDQSDQNGVPARRQEHIESCCRHRRLPSHAQQVLEVKRTLAVLREQLVHNVEWRADCLVNQRPLQCYHIFPLDVLGREHLSELLQVRSFIAIKLFVLGRTLPGLVLLPSEGVLGGLVPEVFLDPVVAMVGPRGTEPFRSRMRKPRHDWGSNPRR